MEPLDLLDGLEIKLRQLAASSDRQRADNERLVNENQQLKRELDRQTGIVTSLKDKLARTHSGTGEAVSDGAPSTANPAAAPSVDRETIEFCLKEIDRCLEWLQRN